MPARKSPLTLTSLPVELLFQTADNLAVADDIYALCHTTADFSCTLKHYFYRRLLLDHHNSLGSALTWACDRGHPSVVRLLLDNADPADEHAIPLPDDLIAYRGPGPETPLIAAVRGGRGCILRIFRWGDYEKKTGLRDAYPLEPLERSRRAETVRLLLIRGVDFDVVDIHQKTALHYCSEYGDSELCRLLLMCGAKASAVDYGRLTPLHLAVACGRYEALKVLLGFDSVRRTIDMSTEDDDTALILAVEAGYCHIVRLLLEHGADFTICNAVGDSPLTLAETKVNRTIANILRAFGAELSRPTSPPASSWTESSSDVPAGWLNSMAGNDAGDCSLHFDVGLTTAVM